MSDDDGKFQFEVSFVRNAENNKFEWKHGVRDKFLTLKSFL